MAPVVQHLSDHAFAIAEAEGIQVEVDWAASPAEMFVPERKVKVPPVTDIPTYLTFLHEIAHVVLGHTEDVRQKDIMAAETKAWDWAVDHSIVETGDEGRYYIEWCLGTYSRRAQTP